MSEQDQHPEVPGHRLDSVIGQGSSGVVWSGRDASGRPVAIKVPHTGLDDADMAQLRVEQHVLRAVRHEHLVPLRDVVELTDGRTALVFDLVQGQVLRAMVLSRGHLRPGEIVTVLTPICEAVAALHSAGGLHSDISAGNITMGPDGRPTLLDLGSARVAGRSPGFIHGTTGFIAPEVLAGDEPSEASDVYALGAVAWFCATGNGAPDTPLRLDAAIIESHVGSELAEVIGACIDPDPGCRPSSAELARRFFDAAPAEPIEVVVESDPAAALTRRLRDAASRDPVGPVEPEAARRWPRLAALVVAVAVPVLAGAAWAIAVGMPPNGGVPVAPATRATPISWPARPAVAGSSPAGSAVEERVVRAADSPSMRSRDLLQVLSDRRARALVSRDVAALDALHRGGSPSALADRRLVESLQRAGLRWEALRLEVGQATFVSGTTTEAVVRARVDWTAYVVVGATGSRTSQPAERGQVLDFHLERGADGWRIDSISDAPAS